MKKKYFFKKIIFIFLTVFIFISVFGAWEIKNVNAMAAPGIMDINVRSTSELLMAGWDKAQTLALWLKQWAKDEMAWLRDEGIALAYKRALGFFMQQLAYDTATYLATGEKGAKPMFYTEGWGEYLKNVADNAAGAFLEELGRSGPTKFNLCETDVIARIGLGLQAEYGPPQKPDCTFSEMKKNWENELGRKDFLVRLQDMFRPESSDLGIAFTLHTRTFESKLAEQKLAELERSANKGIKDVKEEISGKIKTPAAIVRDYTDSVIAKTGNKYFTYTGHALADAIDTFLNTLVGKLMEEWLNKGLARSYPDYSYKGDWGQFSQSGFSDQVYRGGNSAGGGTYPGTGSGGTTIGSYTKSGLGSYEVQNSGSGVKRAQKQFKSIIQPSFSVKGDYSAINDLTTCPDPNKAGPNECVITDSFRRAIENKMTVGKAMQEGFLNANAVFGFRADGIEPVFNEGYPYRSLIILRKFRIIPVGWELAAEYIKGEKRRTYNLGDMVACYDPNDRYEGYYASWCEGLVDPGWVLKSPLNFCKKEGPGPKIINKSISGQGDESELIINRDDYCADEQSCVVENNDGSCDLYGYCTEDRRKYNFAAESCDAKFNTCQTFRNKTGGSISFLKNTLDYSNCQSDNAGCKSFVESVNGDSGITGIYDAITNKVDWTLASGHKFFDNDTKDCSEKEEGCHEFIRTKPGVGANLLINGSFEDFDGTVGDGVDDNFGWWGNNIGDAVETSFYGKYGLRLNAVGIVNHTLTIDATGPDGTVFDLGGQTVMLSLYARDCAGGHLVIDGESVLLDAQDWTYFNVAHNYVVGDGNVITISVDGSGCIIDGIKLERVQPEILAGSEFVDYRDKGLVYQRLKPDYLDCGNDDNKEKCDQYVQRCNFSDMDCELYTSQTDDFTVPGVALAEDYCPSECVGYDEYLQSGTFFENPETEYFIPSSAKSCNAQNVGCEAFTNLDKADQSGEAREYYSYLRLCADIDDSAANCQQFFTWEGSDETGYQLRKYALETTAGGGPTITNTGTYNGLSCSATTYDPVLNPMCWEFYDINGNVYYAFYPYTVSCSSDCHPYRRAEVDNPGANTCLPAGSSGSVYWDNTQGACIYHAIPTESVSCSPEAVGCREYNGTKGANERIVFNQDYENGTTEGWTGNVSPSNNSLFVGGHSLAVNNIASYSLGGGIKEGKAYILSFVALSVNDFSFRMINGAGDISDFGPVNAINDGQWHIYEINMERLDHPVDINENLEINGGPVNFEFLRLTEISDRYYLIKDSWFDNCQYEDADPNKPLWPSEGHYAGCDSYTDRDDNEHTLFQFSRLCQEEMVGCELVIDTHNYSDYRGNVWFGGANNICDVGEDDCVSIDPDSYDFVVINDDKKCNAADKGCERFGLENNYTSNIFYYPSYIRDNPDNYDKMLCAQDAVNCEAWETDTGTQYFKDPGDMVCEWRSTGEEGIGRWDWNKKRINRCDDGSGGGSVNGEIDAATNPLTGILEPMENNICRSHIDCALTGQGDCQKSEDCRLNICGTGGVCTETNDLCQSDTDCPLLRACVDDECHFGCRLDENDYPCRVDNYDAIAAGAVDVVPKTFGVGGRGNLVQQPLSVLDYANTGNTTLVAANAEYWAGICPAKQSGCTEFVDPVSDFSFEVNVLDPFTLYRNNALTGGSINIASLCANSTTYPRPTRMNIFLLDLDTNMLVPAGGSIPGGALFYYTADRECLLNNRNWQIKKAIVDYQLNNKVDRKTCNGVVDTDEGCILFNERKIGGATGYEDLIFNTQNTNNGETPDAATTPFDANSLIKVSPDRVCNKWLACKSFIKDKDGNNVCFEIGLCDGVDDNGNCDSFINSASSPINQSYDSSGGGTVSIANIANMTGYVKVGNTTNNSGMDNDYYKFGDMRQHALTTIVPNGSFEQYGSNFYPLGWTWPDGEWNRGVFRVINNPVAAQKEGIDYPVDGKSFMKMGTGNFYAQSEWIEAINTADSEYFLTVYINTINLVDGTAVLRFYNANPDGGNIEVPAGLGWKKYMRRFTVNGSRFRIILESTGTNGGNGNFYVDNIKIRPVLSSRENWNIPQTCRLYPENDSLSCDYNDNSGSRNKGWYGYCLEYDRFPGSSDACLMWYPVDRVYGDAIEEGAGYNDLKPLYYCIGTEQVNYGDIRIGSFTQEPTPVEEMVDNYNLGGASSGGIDITHRNPLGWSEDVWTLEQLGLGGVDEKWLDWNNIDHIRIRETHPSSYCEGILQPSGDEYYRFDQAHPGQECNNRGTGNDCDAHAGGSGSAGIQVLTDPTTGLFNGLRTTRWDAGCNHPDLYIREIVIYPKVFMCNQVVQTVTPTGRNKYYSNHIYEGSNSSFPCNNDIPFADPAPGGFCVYNSDQAPFGAVLPPGQTANDWSIMSNPFEWDSRDQDDGKQPLFYEFPGGSFLSPSQARMGQEYSVSTIQGNGDIGMFAQAYGIWTWNPINSQLNGQYDYTSDGWVVGRANPVSIPGAAPGAAILINGRPSGSRFPVNSLIHLTFNTDADDNQLPLVSYTVNWDDGSITSVSGIEMRDRPEASYPHSLYHIYSETGNYNIQINVRDNWGGEGNGNIYIVIEE